MRAPWPLAPGYLPPPHRPGKRLPRIGSPTSFTAGIRLLPPRPVGLRRNDAAVEVDEAEAIPALQQDPRFQPARVGEYSGCADSIRHQPIVAVAKYHPDVPRRELIIAILVPATAESLGTSHHCK